MKTFKAIWSQEWLLAFREWMSMVLALGIPVGFFLIFSATYDVSSYEMAIQNVIFREVLMMMTISSILSLVLYNLPSTLQEDRQTKRLLAIKHSPVPIWQYYLAKMLRLLINFAVSVLVVFTVGYLVKHISMSAGDWIMSVLLLLLGAGLLMPFGILLSLIKSNELLSIVSNIAFMGSAVLGGLWYPLETFPDWLQSIGKVLPTYHALKLLTSYFEDKFSWQSLVILGLYAIIVLGLVAFIRKRQEVN